MALKVSEIFMTTTKIYLKFVKKMNSLKLKIRFIPRYLDSVKKKIFYQKNSDF